MAALFRVKAVYDYASPHEDDLNFPAGQVIAVTDEDDDDWYGGQYVDDAGVKKEGIFPRNFVEKFEPTAPPRPVRTRTKRDHDVPQQPAEETHPAAPPPPAQEQSAPAPEPEPVEATPPAPATAHAQQPAPAPVPAPSKPLEAAPAPLSPPAASKPDPPAPAASKPKPAAPPPVSEKPQSSSFKDRIAAFNKSAAPPIAPPKPGDLNKGGTSSGFVKKPFVAPPPSRNAFVPPPRDVPAAKVYRREEDPEIKEREAEAMGQAEKAGLVTGGTAEAGDDNQPKPQSLKERIALLQKQQAEQAQRHADAAAKKEKAKRPPKQRTESMGQPEPVVEPESPATPAPAESNEVDEPRPRTSTDEGHATRAPPPPRRRASKGPAFDTVHDGNEADMSGAGDTTEGHDDTAERDESEGTSRPVSRAPPPAASGSAGHEERQDEEDEEEEQEVEEEVDPEIKRREELRARMAKMSGGMGFHGMFGAPMPSPGAGPPKAKKTPKTEHPPSIEEGAENGSSIAPQGAPPIPTMIAVPGMGGTRRSEETARPSFDETESSRGPPPPVPSRQVDEAQDDEESDNSLTPAPTTGTIVSPPDQRGPPPPVPGGRPAPPPVPTESRPPPPPPHADVKSPTEGSESDDELSGSARDKVAEHSDAHLGGTPRAPPPPPQPLQSPVAPREDEYSPSSPTATSSKRTSRPPPPIPGTAPALPPASGRPPPPPPPPGSARRQSGAYGQATAPTGPPQAGEENDEEVTEYEGDYDTDIASSVPHKDALKAHARDSSQEENSLKSPISEAPPSQPPPIPTTAAPRAVPPPIPSHPPPDDKRQSLDAPRGAPPPPPPHKTTTPADTGDYDPFNYSAPTSGVLGSSYSSKTPKIEESAYFPSSPSAQSPPDRRAPPLTPGGRPTRQSLDVQRGARRSMDVHRPSMESRFIANDIDLALQSGWWKQANQVPPALQGRKDIYFESEESTSTNRGSKTIVTREIFVLYQDYSQTVLMVRFDPYDPSDVEIEQRHEPPPAPLRQDQMEEYYERFGRPISDAVAARKDSVVGDGTPQGLVLELLRPFKDALMPVGTRAYGALVYSNMANASTQQNDMIRAGDIVTIRNAKFQGKHGAMHAKYSMEVGKPDHVAIVAEWDGTKKKVRAWEQGRESKKAKMESFKLDDLRSGEVKIWRVMPRSWVGWSSQP